MKKLLSLAALVLMLCVAACQQGGYKISGTVQGAADGDTVILSGDLMPGLDKELDDFLNNLIKE